MLPNATILQDAEVSRRPSVQLDYTRFRRRDALTRWKNRLIVALFIVAAALGGWWWWIGWRDGGNSPQFSPGPVAAVHAAWENQCTVCHAPGEATVTGWGAQTFGVSHTPDSRCQDCHPGPIHHATQSAADTPTCAACHLDHRGRQTDLTQHGDRFCTVCHADLGSHLAEGATLKRLDLKDSKINGWASHPKFALPENDPTQLKFNHQLHLAAGMAREGAVPLMTWGQVDAALRERMHAEKADAAAPVRLDCAACHQPDDATGAIMKPIKYETHCQACHPLTIKLPNDRSQLQIPHGWQPAALHDLLQGLVLGRAMHTEKPDLFRPPWRLPGKDEPVQLMLADRLTAIERDMISSKKLCGECHVINDGGTGALLKSRLEPTHVTPRWYSQAKFNHAAHRMAECRACHSAAETSTTSVTVAIPNLDNCRQCHGAPGGVRAACVDCHRFHNGDEPQQGPGAPARAPTPRTIEQFLRPQP